MYMDMLYSAAAMSHSTINDVTGAWLAGRRKITLEGWGGSEIKDVANYINKVQLCNYLIKLEGNRS